MRRLFFRGKKVYLRINDTKPASQLKITNEDQFTGKSFVCQCEFMGKPVMGTWTLVSGGQYAQMNENGKVFVNESAVGRAVTVRCQYGAFSARKTITVSYGNQLEIDCPSRIVGTSGNAVATYNSEVVSPEWSIASGGQNAQIGQDGSITVTASGPAVVRAAYAGYTTQKSVQVEYKQGASSETAVDENGTVTTSTTVVVENPDGTTTSTTTSTSVREDGFTSQTESTLVENEDGSSRLSASTVNQDGTTSRREKETGADGSSASTTTNYDAAGTATTTINNNTDVSGNESIQNISYNSSGDSVVTGYSIDTSNSQSGQKLLDEDEVNTQFYGFDSVTGFNLNLHFTIDFTDQPPDQNQNHHNILTMKRADPSPWYGFHMRQDRTTKEISLGTQFSTGSNASTTIYPIGGNWIVGGQIAEFNFDITYDPTLSSDTFVVHESITDREIYTSDSLFPDIPELRYLTVCLGCALDQNYDPYRYSKINILNFNIQKLDAPLLAPTMAFSENVITITCSTLGAEIFYKTSASSTYVKYANPIEISQDTTIYTYSKLREQTSEIVTQSFAYDDGIEEPIIICDGEQVEITCETMGADIYYRIGTSGNFALYSEPIDINQTVTVQSYSTIDGNDSEIVTETCTYVPIVLSVPTISCQDNWVTISCETPRSQIYYRVGDEGSFSQYTDPFEISEDVVVYAYSMHREQTSTTVSEECKWTPAHDYSKDYLTFRVTSPGTITWNSVGSLTKTIEYSINDGEWTSITSASPGAAISVAKDDVVRFRGNNATYATSKSAYSAFGAEATGSVGTASFEVEGNIMSLLYGDNFQNATELTNSTYQFCQMFKQTNAVSAKNLVLPAAALKNYCYRAMFSKCHSLAEAPELPATTLAKGCYWYMFEECPITVAPELNATTLVQECYGNMFNNCSALNTVVCRATTSLSATNCRQNWLYGVASTGTFVRAGGTDWGNRSTSAIPVGWTVLDDVLVYQPTIVCDGENVYLSCATENAEIYYRLGQTGEFQLYTQPIAISQDTLVEAYSALGTHTSATASATCIYVQETPFARSNKSLPSWIYLDNTVTTPYSVNRIDGHSSNYARNSFNFETAVNLRAAQPTYLWFQHADQTADIYVDNNLVGRHWGGYAAFFFDISEYVHVGINNIKVVLNNTNRQTIAPCAGDFNFNATLGNVKLFTSPCLPAMKYGYDGFHITSTVTSSSATVNVKTAVPSGATLVCTITNKDGYQWSDTKTSNGEEQTFSTTITGANLHLWGGKPDPYLYNVKLEIYKDNELYHRYERPYGLRFYEYAVNKQVNGESYTGFLLNGQPYLLRGVCMHDDLAGKANALTDADYDQEFAVIEELGCNFLRLAHYPHPKEVYDRCDQLGIIVQTEGPCVNKMQSTLPEEYFTHLTTQYTDMVEQHFNHPCIVFWGLFNETTTDDKAFAKEKINGYIQAIRDIDPERLIGYVMNQSSGQNPSGYYNDPDADWFGCNIYVGWYDSKTSNDPTQQINKRLNNTLVRIGKPVAFSEYGAGGTQHCHSDNYGETTTPGNYARHDIEYQMWLHEGHVAAIRNFPQLLFTSAWQLFDIAVSNRNEGYIECLDGETASENDELRRLNNKGLVERDHATKKDTFYLYKAEWNSEDKFVHICGKDYTKTADRALKCYTNDAGPLSLYEGNSQTALETAQVVDHIAQFTARTFSAGVEYRVAGVDASDSVTFQASN